MTESETKMFNVAIQAIDAMLDALSSGCGIHDFSDMRSEWHEKTGALREAINAERKAAMSSEDSR